MIALPSQVLQDNQTLPHDTGCVFPYGKGQADLRVFLLTDNKLKATHLGRRLADWGLPRLQQIIAPMRHEAMVVVNPALTEMIQGHRIPRPIRFGGDAILLQGRDPENMLRFSRWLSEHWTRDKDAEHRAKMKNPSLNDLADAGEIETIEV